jgi:hypothetical protein
MRSVNSFPCGVPSVPEEHSACLSLLIRSRGQNRRDINELATLALVVETTPQRADAIGLSGPPAGLKGIGMSTLGRLLSVGKKPVGQRKCAVVKPEIF